MRSPAAKTGLILPMSSDKTVDISGFIGPAAAFSVFLHVLFPINCQVTRLLSEPRAPPPRGEAECGDFRWEIGAVRLDSHGEAVGGRLRPCRTNFSIYIIAAILFFGQKFRKKVQKSVEIRRF